MIIQCRQCRTKFRFDDSLMEGDGVWMRCSHCQHVFFQDNPQMAKPVMEPQVMEKPFPGQGVTPIRRPETSPSVPSGAGGDEDVALFLDNVMQAKNNLDEKGVPEIEKPVIKKNIEEEITIASEEVPKEDKQQEKKASPGGWARTLKVALWTIFVIIVIPVLGYYFVFPQIGDRVLKVVNKYVDLGISETARPEVVVGQVKLQDIRQRILTNHLIGSIRIVEGTAVNQADYPISRIAIKGEIVDAYAVILAERTSFAGNVLTDQDLAVLPEDEIFKRLSRPEGHNNSNHKIMPNGTIPFMIVFTREPAGVIKTTVRTVGAERLL